MYCFPNVLQGFQLNAEFCERELFHALRFTAGTGVERANIRISNGFCGHSHVGSQDTGILACRTAGEKMMGGARNASFSNGF